MGVFEKAVWLVLGLSLAVQSTSQAEIASQLGKVEADRDAMAGTLSVGHIRQRKQVDALHEQIRKLEAERNKMQATIQTNLEEGGGGGGGRAVGVGALTKNELARLEAALAASKAAHDALERRFDQQASQLASAERAQIEAARARDETLVSAAAVRGEMEMVRQTLGKQGESVATAQAKEEEKESHKDALLFELVRRQAAVEDTHHSLAGNMAHFLAVDEAVESAVSCHTCFSVCRLAACPRSAAAVKPPKSVLFWGTIDRSGVVRSWSTQSSAKHAATPAAASAWIRPAKESASSVPRRTGSLLRSRPQRRRQVGRPLRPAQLRGERTKCRSVAPGAPQPPVTVGAR